MFASDGQLKATTWTTCSVVFDAPGSSGAVPTKPVVIPNEKFTLLNSGICSMKGRIRTLSDWFCVDAVVTFRIPVGGRALLTSW